MSKLRLDQLLVDKGLAPTRSKAADMIATGEVTVDGKLITKAGYFAATDAVIQVTQRTRYVSRGGDKLASVAGTLRLSFRGKTVLDVGSSTGGFTDYALQHGATQVIAVEVGTKQLHPSLTDHPKIELHEQTDIRDIKQLSSPVDIVVIDVSFVTLRDILPSVARLAPKADIVAMVKPQFEAAGEGLKHKGVIKNDAMRRDILKNFESWAKQHFIIIAKADSAVAGSKGNVERFYVLRRVA